MKKTLLAMTLLLIAGSAAQAYPYHRHWRHHWHHHHRVIIPIRIG